MTVGHHIAVQSLASLVASGDVAILSGAGLSTESGIPDYRGPLGLARRGTPMTFQAFISGPEPQRRYWARSHAGWTRMSSAKPNLGHRAVTELEQQGLLAGVITQNVDGLHSAAGTRNVIDLHGRLDRISCLGCHERTTRESLNARLHAANPDWLAVAVAVNADGDVELSDTAVDGFSVVDCLRCGGVLKPDVVYFGERVPSDRVDASFAVIDRAAALMVLGSSLTVYSGRRFVVRAAERGIPIAIVNDGFTRCDDLAAIKLSLPLGEVLAELVKSTAALVAARC
ncbi:MAG: NAD-dependent protein deacetylase [Candidatus Nanopelagicales bacterium]